MVQTTAKLMQETSSVGEVPRPGPVDLHGAVTATTREALAPAATGLAIIYAATAVSHALILDAPIAGPLASVAGLSAAIYLMTAIWLRRRPAPVAWVHPVGAALALLSLTNEALQQQLDLDPSHQKYISILLLATGAFMLSTPWLLFCMALALASWGLATWRAGGDWAFIDWIYAHVTCAILALVVHAVRRRTILRIEALRQTEAIRARDLQQALSELRASESLFREFADQSGEIFWINDGVTHQVTYVNRVYEDLIGRSIEQLRADPLDWISAIHPDDRERVRSSYIESLESGVFDQQYRIVRPDGSIRWVHDHGFFVEPDDGGVRRIGGIVRDITDRVRTELDLRHSEQTNRAILQAIPDMIIRISRDGRFLAVQRPKNFEALWVTPERIGSSIADLLPPELAGIGRRHVELALTTGEVQTHEYAWHGESGDFWREWRIAPVGADDVLVIVRDITARKLAEDALHASRQRLSDLIADIDGIVWECEPRSFRFSFVSARAGQMLGYPIEDWTNDPQFFLRILHPDDRERITKYCEQRTALGMDHEMDYRLVAADGRVIWVHDKVRVVKDEQGRPVRLCGLLIDITESMRSAQALRESQLILDKAQEIASLGSWTWEAARDRVTWSPQMYRIYGITPAEFDGSWTRAFEMIHPDDQQRVWQAAQRAIATGDVEAFEYRILRPDGTERIVRADGEIHYGEQGELDRVIGTVQDITDLRHAQAERQRLEDELKQAQKLEAVGTLATGVAHDFNNLLTAINGYVDLTRESLPVDAKAHQTLDMIELATEQAAGVTHSLLTFGHRTPTEKSAIDLVPNIRQSLQLLRRLLPANIELVEDLPDHDEVFVNANGHQLQQVWLNLTINARDAMPAGGKLIIRVRKHAEAPDSPNDSWHGHPFEAALITVSDTGTGMSEKIMQRIFEPYFTTKPRGQGTGLGLSIVHGIVTDHGGRIRVQSEQGRGARFIIQLPLCPPPVRESLIAAARAAHRGRGQTILLAEDNEFVRAVIASSLQAAGYRVLSVADGEQAMQEYERHPDDLGLLLLDIDLPRHSGEQCLADIRSQSPVIPAILMSGSLERTEVSALDGREVRIAKPFQITRLIELVDQMLTGDEIES